MNDRPVNQVFTVGEFLFRRCPANMEDNPFGGLRLIDISVNRSGTELEALCEPNDVLYNMNPDDGKGEILEGGAVIGLRIAELNAEGQYEKTETRIKTKNGQEITNTCLLRLRHKPEECNYSHCALEVYYDGIEMTPANYNQNLGKHSILQSWCKNEIVKMVIKKEIWINWPNTKQEPQQPT